MLKRMHLEVHGFILHVGYIEIQHYPIGNEFPDILSKKMLEIALQNREVFNFATSSIPSDHSPLWSKNIQVNFPVLIRDKIPDSYSLPSTNMWKEHVEDEKKTEQSNQNSNQNLLLL